MSITRRQFVAGTAMTITAPMLAHAQNDSYVLGTLFPMSGPVAELGNVFMQGVQLALEHIKQDKLLAHAIELRAQDSQATPQGGAVGMTRLANVDLAPYVLLAVTGVSKAAAPIGARKNVVMVNGGGVSPELADLSPYFWNVIPLADQEVPGALNWLKQERLLRVALVYIDDPLGAAILKQLQTGLPKIGGQLVGSYSVPPGIESFAAIAAKLREAKPDAVYFASYGTQQLQIIKQLRDNGVTQQLLTYSIGSLPSVAAMPEAEGLVFTTQAFDLDSAERLTRRFVSDWRSKYKSNPTSYAQNYYNGTLLYAYLAASLEKKKKPVTGDNLLAELRALKRFQFVGGEVSFTDKATTVMPIQLNRVSKAAVSRIG